MPRAALLCPCGAESASRESSTTARLLGPAPPRLRLRLPGPALHSVYPVRHPACGRPLRRPVYSDWPFIFLPPLDYSLDHPALALHSVYPVRLPTFVGQPLRRPVYPTRPRSSNLLLLLYALPVRPTTSSSVGPVRRLASVGSPLWYPVGLFQPPSGRSLSVLSASPKSPVRRPCGSCFGSEPLRPDGAFPWRATLPPSPSPTPPPPSSSSLQTFAFTSLRLWFARGPSGPPMAGSSTTLCPGPHAGSTGLARTLPKPLSSPQVLGFSCTSAGPRFSLAAQHTAAASQHRLLLLLTQPRDRLSATQAYAPAPDCPLWPPSGLGSTSLAQAPARAD